MQNLHQLVENDLEAPALAWNILAYYWGMSAFGLGPAYQDYVRDSGISDDERFDDSELNQIAGLKRSLTIKERFTRASNFYAYCYEAGRRSAINPPFDSPPTVDDMLTARMRSESKPMTPDKMIQATNESLLGDNPELLKLWAFGTEQEQQRRAAEYDARIRESLTFVAEELRSSVTPEQLSEIGFLVEGHTGQRFNVTTTMMDETMPPDVQDKKFGECYLQTTPNSKDMVLSGIFGAYFTMGHNPERAMYYDNKLVSVYHAIMLTWRQLHEVSKNECV